MTLKIETDRLILRELALTDASGMYLLDADPEVHRYLGNKPITSMEQAQDNILFIQTQYEKAGSGRWAVEDKISGQFMGWGGLKFITDVVNDHQYFYEVGYRLIPAFWGKGYATEIAVASIHYGFKVLGLTEIFAMTDVANLASQRVLEKAGMQKTEQYIHNLNGQLIDCYWFRIGTY